MKRVIVICEGRTEQLFAGSTLFNHLLPRGIQLQAPIIKASRGGIIKWPALKKQVEIHLKSEPNAYVTTFIDYYGLYGKHGFPDWEAAEKIQDKYERLNALETAMRHDIASGLQHRFLPYLQLHEFEGLLFTDGAAIVAQIPAADLTGRPELEATVAEFPNPEMINDQKETSPSHRLQRIIRGYQKVVYGNILAEAIGVERMRARAPRFHNWLSAIEKLPDNEV
jgi:Domain of unknown function (DUF4276)